MRKFKKRYLYNALVKTVPILGDLLLVYFSFASAYYFRFHSQLVTGIFPAEKGIPDWQVYHHTIIGICFGWVIVFLFSKLYYRNYVSGFDEFVKVIKSVTLATIISTAATFLYREFEYSRLVLGIAWALSVVFIFVFHELFKILEYSLIYKIFGPRRILMLGNGKTTEAFKNYFEINARFKAYYKNSVENIKDLNEFCREKRIEEIIVASLKVKHEELSELSDICDEYGIDLRIVPDILELRMGELIVDDSFGLPLLRIKAISLHGVNRIIKRAFDVAFSVLFLGLFILPLTLLSLLIIIETPGNVFYLRKRVGFKGDMFLFFKFRSMVINADQLLSELKSLSERIGPVFKMRNDPRITLLGRIMRKYSLDEIPQIINVLKGEMSIIGPRPQVIWEAEAYDKYAFKRLNALPGITGLWQVSGRAKLSYEEMIWLDIFYIENWSLGLDLKILLKTIPTVLLSEGAY